jgi:hypothetical protein
MIIFFMLCVKSLFLVTVIRSIRGINRVTALKTPQSSLCRHQGLIVVKSVPAVGMYPVDCLGLFTCMRTKVQNIRELVPQPAVHFSRDTLHFQVCVTHLWPLHQSSLGVRKRM